MDIDRDFLCSLSPLFRLNDVKIYWCDQVNKVGQTNSLRPRILVIASPGIYLIHKKSFAFQSRIVTSISFFDLVSLYVAGDCASFSSRTNQIRVKHQNMADVAFLVFFIRQMQFPTDLLPLNVTLANKSKETFNTPPYQPRSLFLDRLLSCIMHSNVMITNTTLQSSLEFFPESSDNTIITKTPSVSSQTSPQSSNSLSFTAKSDSSYSKSVDSLYDNSHVYTFTSDILNSPLLEELILSLAYEQNVDTLKFKGIKLSSILPKCSHIVRSNRFIQTVIFIDVDFDGSENISVQLFSKPHGFKPMKWVFDSCDLSRKSFNVFFDVVSKNVKKITHLQFIDCVFSNELTFPNLLQSIFFNDGLHALQHLIIDNCVSNDLGTDEHCYIQNLLIHVSEILCCSWAMELKCLHQLSVTKSGSDDCSLFLSQALNFGVGIEYINLSQNNFVSILNIDGFCELKFLGLKNCILSMNFLQSFVDLLKKRKLTVHSLDLSGMRNFLNASEFSSFLKSLQDVQVDELETLIFDNNPMNSNQTVLFINFLSVQKKLANLSINCSISIKESPNGLLSFISYVSSKAESDCPLASLSIRGDKSMEFSFERLLKPLFKGISETIQNLDITSQKVGQESLEVLVPLIKNGQLTELFFDGSNVKSFDFLNTFCEVILSSEKLSFASFPEDDFNNIQTNLSISELLPAEVIQMENRIVELKFDFEKRFSSLYHKKLGVLLKADLIHLLYSNTKTVKTAKTVERKAKFRSSSSSGARMPVKRKSSFVLLPTDDNSAIAMKPELEKLYKECVGSECDEENDPILSLINLVENEISFENLFSECQESSNGDNSSTAETSSV